MNKMPPSLFICSLRTQFKEVSIVWNGTNSKTIVRRIFLSSENVSASVLASAVFPGVSPSSNHDMKRLTDEIKIMMLGHSPDFDIDILDFGVCSSFQRKVLMEERNIPRGEVLSYGQLALRLAMPSGARAAGNALAANPFPLVIPCHRTIKANGRVGKFQGGSAMKRALLEMEGIIFSPSGKVL
jgi:methylated-DNA-[protein]-cysteine S-methyltransferase